MFLDPFKCGMGKQYFLCGLQRIILATKATGGMIAEDLRGWQQLNKKPRWSQGAPEQLEQITGMKSLSQFVRQERERERNKITFFQFNRLCEWDRTRGKKTRCNLSADMRSAPHLLAKEKTENKDKETWCRGRSTELTWHLVGGGRDDWPGLRGSRKEELEGGESEEQFGTEGKKSKAKNRSEKLHCC